MVVKAVNLCLDPIADDEPCLIVGLFSVPSRPSPHKAVDVLMAGEALEYQTGSTIFSAITNTWPLAPCHDQCQIDPITKSSF